MAGSIATGVNKYLDYAKERIKKYHAAAVVRKTTKVLISIFIASSFLTLTADYIIVGATSGFDYIPRWIPLLSFGILSVSILWNAVLLLPYLLVLRKG